MSTLTYDHEDEWEIDEEDIIEFTCIVTFHPGSPGYLSGPPERCYPPEGDTIEFSDITVWDGVLGYKPSPHLLSMIEEYLEHQRDGLTEKFSEQYNDDVCAAAERWEELKHER